MRHLGFLSVSFSQRSRRGSFPYIGGIELFFLLTVCANRGLLECFSSLRPPALFNGWEFRLFFTLLLERRSFYLFLRMGQGRLFLGLGLGGWISSPGSFPLETSAALLLSLRDGPHLLRNQSPPVFPCHGRTPPLLGTTTPPFPFSPARGWFARIFAHIQS